MHIREATETDIPSIVNLLKISLGESFMPKTESFWRWKHIDNPFGKSPVLLAFEDEALVGVRAFMRWEWQHNGQIIKAVRAVDTATHPGHQGKGIFRKLTLQLVELCEQEGVQFIYNTPNAKSKPGYIKMGWETLGRMKLYVKPVLGLKMKAQDSNNSDLEISKINIRGQGSGLVTHISTDFFLWRYVKNPNIKYHALLMKGEGEECSIIYRLKQGRLGMEFRICEQMGNAMNKAIQNQLLRTAMASGARLVTSSMRIPGLLSMRLKKGPEITVRKLSSLHNSLTFSQWHPTLGDMEVF